VRSLRSEWSVRTRRARGGRASWHRDCSIRVQEDEMARKWMSVALALAFFVVSAGAIAESLPEPRYGPCRAERTLDGATAELICGVERVRVRLLHVAPPHDGETGHAEAARGLRALLRGREIFLAFATPGQPTLDRDGTLLVQLYDRAGQNLNVALVSLGWAAYTASGGPDPLALHFQAAEREARAEQRAMWSVWAYTVGRGDPGDASQP
jgi:endonuclease YncB( thermonuclease family)